MNFKQLYGMLLTTLILSANLFAAGDMAPELAGFFEGNGGVGVISKVRLINPNDPTFGGCRLNFGGQILEFGANGGEKILSRPIGYDDQITTYPGTPFLQSADAMTLRFVETVGIVRKGYSPQNDSLKTVRASENLAIAVVVVRLAEVYPTLAELDSAVIQSVKTEDNLPIYNYSAIQHLVKTGMAHECYSYKLFDALTDKKLHNAFTTGCLDLAFPPVAGREGALIKVYDKVATFTDLQSALPNSVKLYEVIMDISHNLLVDSGNYARELVCNN